MRLYVCVVCENKLYDILIIPNFFKKKKEVLEINVHFCNHSEYFTAVHDCKYCDHF